MEKRAYTNLPLGTKVERGEIQICPHCGRRGIAENDQGAIYYIHAESLGRNAQGNMEFKWESCPAQRKNAQSA